VEVKMLKIHLRAMSLTCGILGVAFGLSNALLLVSIGSRFLVLYVVVSLLLAAVASFLVYLEIVNIYKAVYGGHQHGG
jgi:uncharacterized membrane protein YdcZ (DUF606 family)